MTVQQNNHHPSSKLPLTAFLMATAALLGGCASPAPVMDPFAGLREAQTREQVEKQASRDPFPSPSDVGLK
jgi:hypothetical protein